MLGLETQYCLRDFLRTVAERELQIESQRQILGAIHDFEPYGAFCRINRHDDKKITADEILNFLQQNGVTHLTERDCGRVITYFDGDTDNGLNYKEWMEVLLPCDDLHMRAVITQRPSYDCARHQNLSTNIERQIANLLKQEIEYHIYLENVKHSLVRRVDWSNMRAFQAIATRGEGFLGYDNIMNFCRMNSYLSSESDVIAIIRRFDVNADQQITFEEFSEMMDDQDELAPAMHGDPTSDNREDPYFRHTSPAKTYQTRTPRKGDESHRGNDSSPMIMRVQNQDGQLQSASAASLARDTWESRQNEQPLRASSPPARKAYEQSNSKHTSGNMSAARCQQSTMVTTTPRGGKACIGGHCTSCCYPPLRADSPMRGETSPPRVTTVYMESRKSEKVEAQQSAMSAFRNSSPRQSPQYSARQSRASLASVAPVNSVASVVGHRSCCPCCARPCGCSNIGPGGPPCYIDQQAFMVNSTPKQQPSARIEFTTPNRQRLRYDDEQELASAFRELIKLEQEMDEAKSQLASQPDFNLQDAFQMLDICNQGSVCEDEMMNALADLGVYPHKDDVYLFVRRYDKNNDGRIVFSEFINAFKPSNELQAAALQRRPAHHVQGGYCRNRFFMTETRDMFLSAVRQHFAVEEQAEMLRKRLCSRPGFNVHDAFGIIDTNQNGYLGKAELRQVMAQHCVYASDKDLNLLVSRFDRNGDGCISYAEFTEEMIPKCPYK